CNEILVFARIEEYESIGFESFELQVEIHCRVGLELRQTNERVFGLKSDWVMHHPLLLAQFGRHVEVGDLAVSGHLEVVVAVHYEVLYRSDKVWDVFCRVMT